MKTFSVSFVACMAFAWGASAIPAAFGQPPAETSAATREPVRPRQPGGLLGDSLGDYLTIEGVPYDGAGKVEGNTLMVDTLNGKKLDKPIGILIHNVRRLQARQRYVLKGYELGQMIGTPPAVRVATEELGQKYVEQSAAGWRWRPYFVVLIPVEPQGLELLKR